VTYRAVFPSIIPPPFFNSLIATVYSYRATSTTSSELEQWPQYTASELVDWLRVDRVGCDDCAAAVPPARDDDDDDVVDADAVSTHDDQSLCHHVLIELLAHSRVVQVTRSIHSDSLNVLSHRIRPRTHARHGTVPYGTEPRVACRFHTRCSAVRRREVPDLV